MATKRRAPAQQRWASAPRKKTLNLDQALLDQVRESLGVRTETEAVTRALEAVLQRHAQIRGLRALAALGPIDPSRIR